MTDTPSGVTITGPAPDPAQRGPDDDTERNSTAYALHAPLYRRAVSWLTRCTPLHSPPQSLPLLSPLPVRRWSQHPDFPSRLLELLS